MRRVLNGLVWLLCCALPVVASAQTSSTAPPAQSDTQSVKIGAMLFYDYTATTSPDSKDADGNSITPNGFDIKRAYINVIGTISPLVSFRITPDIIRDSGSGSLNGSLTFRIQYAYAQLNFDRWTGAWEQSFVRLGMQQTPFIDFEEGIYRYRFQGPVFFEREGAMAAADAGATFHSNLPKGFGDVHVGVYNGEGQKAEANDQKAFVFRGTVRPFAGGSDASHGLSVTGFYDADHYQKNAPRNRFAANLSYEHTHFNVGVDYLRMTDQPSTFASEVTGSGWSAFLTPFVREKGHGLEGLIRLDRYTPNSKLSGREKQRAIAGLAFWFPHPGGPAIAAIMLDFEQLKFAGFPSNIPANRTQQQIAIHGLIDF
jgi:hypothetical protein